ncbi:MAG TPA: hypothetical protein DD391_09315 [Clostridiales bacterium]|jgi:sugar phosphate isomerase/epimerase|nr:sugar phosphate isomerase/epimerase [Clostridiales bacterium]HBL82765.1 hypothetical protein [Clostridiales bacterium]
MWNSKLCLGTSKHYGISIKEQIKLFKETGFEAFFVNWDKNINIQDIKEYADETGMIFQSIHAPFEKSADMWTAEEKADVAVAELIECLNDCGKNNVPIMVCHAFIGFDKHSPNDIGIKNFRKVIEEAKKVSVKIAFENTEGEEYLMALMNAFADYDNVGFCWDTGHEMCYNHSKDMMELYGSKIICTHINDNLGIKDYNGEIVWTDDLHLLPFDGVADWKNIAHRLNQHNYNDILTFELNKISKPNRHENDVYSKMSIEEYICEAYKRACIVATLKINDKK